MQTLIMVPNSFPIFHLILNRDLGLRISLPKWFIVQSTILMHLKGTGPTEFQLLSVQGVQDLYPAKLYNNCLAKSCFPSCWKSSSVVPVFKNDGERSDPGKYRPISFLPIISKIFESINDSLNNILTSLVFSLTFIMVFVLFGPLLTSSLFSVKIFTIRWMQVERQGLLHFILFYDY